MAVAEVLCNSHLFSVVMFRFVIHLVSERNETYIRGLKWL
jgi:hypothetical protein